MNAQTKKVSPAYKWVIAAMCFITVLIALGLCSSSKGLFLAPVTTELNLARGLYSVTDTIRYATTSLINLAFAALVMKLGTKRMMILGVLSLACSMLLYSIAPKLPEGATMMDTVKTLAPIYLSGAFLGLGLAWCTTTMVGYVVGKWFAAARGSVMGVILSANGLATAVTSKVLNPVIIGEASVFGRTGFRFAYQLIAMMLLAVVVLLLIFFREAPEEAIEGAAGKGKKKRGRQWVGFEWSEVSKKHYFYITAVCIFLTGMALQSVASVTKAHLSQVFNDEDFVTTVLAVYSLVLCGTKFFTGFSYDMFGLRRTILICHVAAAFSIIGMALVPASMPGLALAAKIVAAFAMPLETIMLPLIAADMFGEKCFPKVMGLFVSINTAGYAVGSPLTNVVYDFMQNYRTILTIYGVMMVVVAVVEQFNLYHAQKDREAFLAAYEASAE